MHAETDWLKDIWDKKRGSQVDSRNDRTEEGKQEDLIKEAVDADLE